MQYLLHAHVNVIHIADYITINKKKLVLFLSIVQVNLV